MTWDQTDPANEAMVVQRDDRLRELLDIVDPPVRRALDLGCGRGEALGALGLEGVGIDVSVLRLRLAPGPVAQADGSRLPFPDDSFDLVLALNVLSSVPDEAARRDVADEVRRVLEPGGRLLWYDQRWPNPANKTTRPVTRRELAELLPGADLDLEPITLNPVMARSFPRSYDRLHKLPVLRSHLIGWIRLPA